MTQEQIKAKELVEKFLNSEDKLSIQLKLTGYTNIKRKAKQCALIAVDEIIANITPKIITHLGMIDSPMRKFYLQVKQEILAL